MIWVSTFGFVLALVAVAFGAAALIISWRATQALAVKTSQSASELTRLSALVEKQSEKVTARLRELETSSPTKLAVRVDALSEAVESIAETHRRFAGKVWQRITKDETANTVPEQAPDRDTLRATYLSKPNGVQ